MSISLSISLSLHIYIYICIYLSISLSLYIYIYIYIYGQGGAPLAAAHPDLRGNHLDNILEKCMGVKEHDDDN